jgi:hypothetical protein
LKGAKNERLSFLRLRFLIARDPLYYDPRPTPSLLCVGMKLSDPDLLKTAEPLIIITMHVPPSAKSHCQVVSFVRKAWLADERTAHSFGRSAAAVERARVGAHGARGGRRVGEGLGVRIVLTDLARPGKIEFVRAPERFSLK